MIYDICVIGSGAGAGPIIYELSKAGAKIVVLEKGPIYTRDDFSKDEIAYTKRDIVTPNIYEQYHTVEELSEGKWTKYPTYKSGWSFSNGSILGGSSNFMSGYFHKLQDKDFKLLSTYGEIDGANIEDWCISLEDLDSYYKKCESLIGISGDGYPFPALKEHSISKQIDKACKSLGFNSYQVPRAIISKDYNHRDACYYSNFCGSYGCSSGAKGSAREALIIPSLKTNNVTIIPNAFVYNLQEKNKKIVKAHFFDKNKNSHQIEAKIFVVAAQAVESSRLLLNSNVANKNGQVGKNLLFSAGGVGSGEFDESNYNLDDLLTPGVFVNRSLKDWYFTKNFKGGVVDFLFEHANPIRKAALSRWDENGNLLWGKDLQDKIYESFNKKRVLNFEVFNDWLANDDCFVSVDKNYKDKFGIPVANIRIGANPHDMKVANFLSQKAISVLKQMGAKNIKSNMSPLPSSNLQAGGCRFGEDESKHVLNPHCQSHEVKNLFVSDGSFMPNGGSVPYTWTIYANSFRVANYLKEEFDRI